MQVFYQVLLWLKFRIGTEALRWKTAQPVTFFHRCPQLGRCLEDADTSSDGRKVRLKKQKVCFLLKWLWHFEYKEESKPVMEETWNPRKAFCFMDNLLCIAQAELEVMWSYFYNCLDRIGISKWKSVLASVLILELKIHSDDSFSLK